MSKTEVSWWWGRYKSQIAGCGCGASNELVDFVVLKKDQGFEEALGVIGRALQQSQRRERAWKGPGRI